MILFQLNPAALLHSCFRWLNGFPSTLFCRNISKNYKKDAIRPVPVQALTVFVTYGQHFSFELLRPVMVKVEHVFFSTKLSIVSGTKILSPRLRPRFFSGKTKAIHGVNTLCFRLVCSSVDLLLLLPLSRKVGC